MLEEFASFEIQVNQILAFGGQALRGMQPAFLNLPRFSNQSQKVWNAPALALAV